MRTRVPMWPGINGSCVCESKPKTLDVHGDTVFGCVSGKPIAVERHHGIVAAVTQIAAQGCDLESVVRRECNMDDYPEHFPVRVPPAGAAARAHGLRADLAILHQVNPLSSSVGEISVVLPKTRKASTDAPKPSGFWAEKLADTKVAKYRSYYTIQKSRVRVLALETYGSCSRHGLRFLKQLAVAQSKKIALDDLLRRGDVAHVAAPAAEAGDPGWSDAISVCYRHILERVSVALWKGNARFMDAYQAQCINRRPRKARLGSQPPQVVAPGIVLLGLPVPVVAGAQAVVGGAGHA